VKGNAWIGIPFSDFPMNLISEFYTERVSLTEKLGGRKKNGKEYF